MRSLSLRPAYRADIAAAVRAHDGEPRRCRGDLLPASSLRPERQAEVYHRLIANVVLSKVSSIERRNLKGKLIQRTQDKFELLVYIPAFLKLSIFHMNINTCSRNVATANNKKTTA